METLTVELKIDRRVDVDVNIEEVVGAINNCVIKKRWSLVSNIINYVQLDINDLTEEQKLRVRQFLEQKLLAFS